MHAFNAIRISAPGGPLRLDQVEHAEPDPDRVRVHLRYAGVNPLDRYVLAGTALSSAGLPRTMGVEGVGEVEGSWYAVYGDGLGISRDGTWAEYVLASRQALIPVPDGLDLRLAASAGVVGATAVRVTHDLGQVGAEDRVLILGAAGGTGTAITSLARQAGATVWGQLGSAGKQAVVERARATPIVAGSAAELRRQIAGLGITVAFDPLGADYTGALVEALVPYGRLIGYGVAAGARASLSMRSVSLKCLTLRGYGGLTESAPRMREAIGNALDALASGRMSIPIDRVLPIGEAEQALDALNDRAVTGKIVLDTRA